MLGSPGRSGGTGIRDGLKIRCPSGLVGSSPTSGTTTSTEATAFECRARGSVEGEKGPGARTGREALLRRDVTGWLLAMLLVLLAPGLATAQMREFKGKVQKVSTEELIVDNGRGDKLRFLPAGDVVVEGEKASWASVAKRDWVIVSWKMMDSPRIAYRVVVIPAPEEP